MKKVLFLLILLNFGLICFSQEIIGKYRNDIVVHKTQVKLTRVFDGDTIEVINGKNEKMIIRLIGIDCYETTNNKRAYKQAYENRLSIEDVVSRGMNAKLFLIRFFKENADKALYIEQFGIDDYGRILAKVYLDKICINEYMLKHKKAIKYNYFKE